MSLKSAVGNAVGLGLLVIAAGAVLDAAYLVGVSLLGGITITRVSAIVFSLGLTVTAGFSGFFVRKAVAGQVMPSKFDTSVAYRGGR
ncbi:hypothetical protein GJR99_13570 [Haloferax sp. MBLA0078]|uniref:Uncharacterized protein n=2 Tax=Haloferax TaxID=2251 RepID=A0A6A8GC26_9EURY|nr:hypothetical protein [Haloferax marinum]KAB1198986.1 hypothetical protein Hfx1150_13590 [Haloferax sp. CBA1150]MRW97596.1 hypothetical protein [Haloferax marinum]